MSIKNYKPKIYNNLNQSEDREICEKALPRAKNLGLKFAELEMTEEVGLTFLHKHFQMAKDEKLICTIKNGKSITKPIKLSEINFDYVPYIWKVEREKNTDKLNWYPVEFVKIDNENCLAKKQFESFSTNYKFQNEIGELLVGLNLQDIFGISTRFRDELIRKSDDILLENTDMVNRVLEIKPVSKLDNNPESNMETGWFFTKDGQGKVSLNCRNSCNWNGGHH